MSALATAMEMTLFDQLGGEPTLDDLIVGAWEGLTGQSVVMCPVCGGEMEAVGSPSAKAVAGRCRDCRTALS